MTSCDAISIILDQGSKFISRFWRTFIDKFGTWVDLNITFHPQTTDLSECTIQIFEQKLWAAFWIFVVIGTVSCLWRSLRIITTTILVVKWSCLRPCIVGVVALW